MQSISTFVINLDSSTVRMSAISDALDQSGISFRRLSAVDMRGKQPEECKNYDADKAKSFFGRPLKGGEIGCYLSHLNAAEAFLQTDAEQGVVLEDDAEIPSHYSRTLQQTIEELNGHPNWELVNLGRRPKQFRKLVAQLDETELFQSFYFPVTTTALLWSRKGAEAFLENHSKIYAPVDHYLRHLMCRRGTGFALMPALVEPTGAESDINGAADSSARHKSKTHKSSKIREAQQQLANYYTAYKQSRM
jgi:glycosyl transferase family 25